MSAVHLLRVALLVVVGCAAAAGDDAAPLFHAIRSNDLAFLQQHLGKTNIDSRDEHGATLLMHAAAFGSPESVRMLLAGGADVNARNAFDATALLWAARDPAKVALLLARGADVNARSRQGRTPLIVAAGGSAESVRLLLAKGADAKAHDAVGITPLIAAAMAGDLDSVRRLVERGADVNAEASVFQDFGSTALMAAAGSANSAVVRYLLTKGATVDTVSSAGGQVKNGVLGMLKMTALMKAAPANNAEAVKALLETRAGINLRDVREMNALMLAVGSEQADPRLVATLLKGGADPNARSAMGETALDWAQKFGNPEIIALLQQAGARSGDPYKPPTLHRPKETPQPAEAIRKSLPLLQRSSTEFLKQSGCVGCHHQHITARAVHAAREIGISLDEAAARDQHKAMRLEWASLREELLQGIEKGGATDRLTQSLLGLWACDSKPDAITDTMVAEIASAQLPEGNWHFGGLTRPPINAGEIGRTAQALRVLQLYTLPGRKAEFEARIGRARAWLVAARPVTTDDYTMRLLGLHWSGADAARVRKAATELIAMQRGDGGWSGNRYLESDAYSTAVALVALRETGSLTAGSAAETRGVEWLLNMQNDDGSWYVRSRAVKFQPYFQSGFPFDHDQWISASATAWAVLALAPAVGHAPATALR